MSTQRLVTWMTFLAVFAMAARVSIDSDTWWHLRAGQWIVENRAIPQADPFSYTRLGAAWQYPGWLVEVPMYGIYQRFGPGGLNLWTAALTTLTFMLLWPALSGRAFLRAFTVILAAAAAGIYWAARPYLVTSLLAAAYLLILEGVRWRPPGDQTARRRLLWLPLLMLVWANSHGGFAVGFLLLGVYGLDALIRMLRERAIKPVPWREADFLHLTGIGLLMLIAVWLNPSGPVMLLYPFKTLSIGALSQYIQEWQPPDFHSAQVQPFVWLLLLTFGAVGASRRRLALTDFLLFAGFAALSFNAARNIALFALTAPLVLTRHAAPILDAFAWRYRLRLGEGATPRWMQRLNLAVFILLTLAVAVKAAAVLPREANLSVLRQTMPAAAVDYLRTSRPPGRLFHAYNWGGYLLWELPEYPVFIDGRTDLYDDELVNEWLRVVRAEAGWQEALEGWGVRLVLIEPGAPLARAAAEAGWTRLYADPVAVVYGR